MTKKKETAIFAAGCFWGVQYYFDQVSGVIKTTAGYTGGHTLNPTYEEVCTRTTGHAEAVEIEYEPDIVTFESLLKHFFRIHDPTELNYQGPDIGDDYRSAIFYTSLEQRDKAKAFIEQLNKKQFKGKIVTELTGATVFYPAEEYHQKYTQKTGIGACHVDYAPV